VLGLEIQQSMNLSFRVGGLGIEQSMNLCPQHLKGKIHALLNIHLKKKKNKCVTKSINATKRNFVLEKTTKKSASSKLLLFLPSSSKNHRFLEQLFGYAKKC